jgi:hypothetical protein
MTMNHRHSVVNLRKKIKILSLLLCSLLLVSSSFVVKNVAAAVTAGDVVKSEYLHTTIRRRTATATATATVNSFTSNSNNKIMDTKQLLRHAIKVDKKFQNRILDEEDGEEDNDSGDEDEDEDDEDENDNDNEDDNEEDEEEDEADDEDDEEEEDSEDEDENEDDEEEEASEDEDEDSEDEDEAEEEEAEDQEPQINFVKCAAFTIEPNIVDVDEMLENGDINDDEVEQIENSYVTKMTSNFNTQESIVFFTLGNSQNDEDRELYMISINDWITASYGYNKICNAIDQNDVNTVFSTIPNFASSSIKQYSNHAWYAGFNCKADGTGFKTQLFLDDTCTTFSPTLNKYYPFKSSNANANANQNAQDYSTQVASDLTKYMVQKINHIIATSQYCDESEFCDNVLETSVDLVTCLKDGEDEANDDDDDDDDCDCNDDEDNEEDEDNEDCDCRRRLRTTTRQQRNLDSYQLSYDEASNVQDACTSIQTALSIDQYEYTDVEAEERISLWSNIKNGGQEADRSSSSGIYNAYWLYLGGLLAAGCIATFLILRMKKFEMKKFGKSCLDSDDNSKNQPLCGSESQVRSFETDNMCEDHSAVECQMTHKERRRKKKSRKSSSGSSTRSSSSRGRSRLRDLKKTKSSSSRSRDRKGPWMSFAAIENDSSKEPQPEQNEQ